VHPYVLKRPEHPVSRRQIDVIALKVLYRLIDAGFVAYLVGGAVRDLMLGRKPKDFDVGTTAHPSDVRALFRNSRLIGRRFPLVHVFFGGNRIVEVATFRATPQGASATDNGAALSPDNSFGTAEEDAFRRDFTINALFYDPKTYGVLDYVSGLADLKLKLVRTVGEAELRMREDPVRMVRAVRLAAKLGFELEPGLRAAIEACRAQVLDAPPARLAEELYRMLAADGSARALGLMRELGLLEVLLPGWCQWLGESSGAWERAAQNLGALEAARKSGADVSRSMMLAGLFAELEMRQASSAVAQAQLVKELRERGFARAEIARVKLLLNALWRLRTRRRLERIARQPYYGEAQKLYQLVASSYGLEPAVPTGVESNHARAPFDGAHKGRRPRRRRRVRRPGIPLAPRSPSDEAAPSGDQTLASDAPPMAALSPPRS
jgi:poly(A) polymerase